MFTNLKCTRPSSFCHYFFKQTKLCSTKASSVSALSIIKPNSVLLDKTNYKIAYEFPLIRITATLVRTRFSVPALCVIALPFGLYLGGFKILILFLLSGFLHHVCMSAFARFSKNMVGHIYMNKEGDTQNVIISSIDEFGRRIDRTHKLHDFMNCDYYSKLSQRLGFVTLLVNNSDIIYKVNINQCKVHNVALCNYLLGNLQVLGTKSNVDENNTQKQKEKKK